MITDFEQEKLSINIQRHTAPSLSLLFVGDGGAGVGVISIPSLGELGRGGVCNLSEEHSFLPVFLFGPPSFPSASWDVNRRRENLKTLCVRGQ